MQKHRSALTINKRRKSSERSQKWSWIFESTTRDGWIKGIELNLAKERKEKVGWMD